VTKLSLLSSRFDAKWPKRIAADASSLNSESGQACLQTANSASTRLYILELFHGPTYAFKGAAASAQSERIG
jgi:threonine synthase